MSKRKETSTNSLNRQALNDFCGMVYTLDILGGRWKMLILYKLEIRKRRFSELRDELPNISERMLTLVLKELEQNDLVKRLVYAEVPVRVEYELTESARALSPVWHAMEQWGDAHKRTHGDIPQLQNA